MTTVDSGVTGGKLLLLQKAAGNGAAISTKSLVYVGASSRACHVMHSEITIKLNKSFSYSYLQILVHQTNVILKTAYLFSRSSKKPTNQERLSFVQIKLLHTIKSD